MTMKVDFFAYFSFLVRFFFFRRNKKEKMNVTKIIRIQWLWDPETSSGWQFCWTADFWLFTGDANLCLPVCLI